MRPASLVESEERGQAAPSRGAAWLVAGHEGCWRDMSAAEGVLAPTTAPRDERGRGEPRNQADDAEGQDPAGVHIAGIADTAQREEERADAEQRRRDAEHTIK